MTKLRNFLFLWLSLYIFVRISQQLVIFFYLVNNSLLPRNTNNFLRWMFIIWNALLNYNIISFFLRILVGSNLFLSVCITRWAYNLIFRFILMISNFLNNGSWLSGFWSWSLSYASRNILNAINLRTKNLHLIT